ncbi:MAG: metallopeptidase family protein [bacterium]|nr:metallopeptidase family protein [bacterium]
MVSKEEFEELVVEGIALIPETFQNRLDNVAIVIEEEPSDDQRRMMRLDEHNTTLLGLYEGIPQTSRSFYTHVLPDKITIFRLPIIAVCSSEEQVREVVRDTVWHEIAHHFGSNEERVRNVELRRKKRRGTIE